MPSLSTLDALHRSGEALCHVCHADVGDRACERCNEPICDECSTPLGGDPSTRTCSRCMEGGE